MFLLMKGTIKEEKGRRSAAVAFTEEQGEHFRIFKGQ